MKEWDEKSVFLTVLGLPEPEREAYLDEACPDEAAKERIRTLLRHHEKAPDDFMEGNASERTEERRTPAQIDEFKVLHRLGEGGMGVVYLAEDTVLGRRVALKVLARHLSGSEQALARFREEARSAAHLTHPGIVPVYRFSSEGDERYIVSEFVEGPTLATVISDMRGQFGRLSSSSEQDWHRRAAEIVAAIADALECAHRANIVHRDVKPSNILLDAARGPRLTDFGIAKHLTEENRTRHTGVIGSCHYMSPEQAAIADASVDQRSDIFSLGVVLYEMLALRLPFDGKSMQQVLAAVIECSPPRLRSVNRRIPRDLETICHKALEKLPHDRYQTAAHVAADLRCYLRGDPILAVPPSLRRRALRLLRKKWKFLATGAVAASIASGSWIVWYRAERQRRELCGLHVTCRAPDVRLSIRAIDGETLEVGGLVELGPAPQNPLLAPGQYRLIAIGDDDAFSEATVLLVRPGATEAIELPAPVKPGPTDEMAYFAGGAFEADAATSNRADAPRSGVLRPFYLDLAEVSNAEYRRFVDSTNHPQPRHWVEFGFDPALADYPVVGVTWDDANAYCRYVCKRLPTAAEWEYAMRWPDGRLLPWGTEAPTELPTVSAESIGRFGTADPGITYQEYASHCSPVRSHAALCSGAGLFHGATNVSEYTESLITGVTTQVIVKGAAWINVPVYHDLTVVHSQPLETLDMEGKRHRVKSMKVGFRCARSAGP